MIWLTGMALYLCIGAALGAVIDSDQMKQPVPYAQALHFCSLRQLRVLCFVIYGCFWLPVLLSLACDFIRKAINRRRVPKLNFDGKPIATVVQPPTPPEDFGGFVVKSEEFGGDESKKGETHGS